MCKNKTDMPLQIKFPLHGNPEAHSGGGEKQWHSKTVTRDLMRGENRLWTA